MLRSREFFGRGMILSALLYLLLMDRLYVSGVQVVDFEWWQTALLAGLAIGLTYVSGLPTHTFQQLFRRLDDGLQYRLTRPLTQVIQTRLHVNRFDLLFLGFALEYAVVHLAFGLMLADDLAHQRYSQLPRCGMFLLAIVIGHYHLNKIGGIHKLLKECREASTKFEAGQLHGLPRGLIKACGAHLTHRALLNVPLVIQLLFVDQLWTDKDDGLHIAATVVQWLMIYGWLAMSHLVTTGNVDPRDRLRRRQPQTQKAKS